MKWTVLSLFPEIIDAYFKNSIMARAIKRNIFEYRSVNIRDYAFDKHKTCDDAPYGGGAGMLLLAEPLSFGLEACGAKKKQECGLEDRPYVIYLSPSGTLFSGEAAKKLSLKNEIIFICGRYEGIDQRIIDLYVDEEISIGDYVMSSGEVAALVVIDTVYRLVDNVITADSLCEESFSGGLLEYPQWTRPEIFASMKVPDILLSGHHENIRRWRLKERINKTLRVRPDLIEKGTVNFDKETLELIAGKE
jgi:tRNA (guanine37-N1)-methyltransferase